MQHSTICTYDTTYSTPIHTDIYKTAYMQIFHRPSAKTWRHWRRFSLPKHLKIWKKKSFHPTAHLYHRELPAVVFLGPMFMFSCHKPSRWAVGQAGGKSLALNEGCGCFKDGLLSYHQLGWHLYFLETHWFPIEEASNNSNTPKGKNDKNGVKSINFNPHPTWNPSNPAVGTSLLLGRSPCQHDF